MLMKSKMLSRQESEPVRSPPGEPDRQPAEAGIGDENEGTSGLRHRGCRHPVHQDDRERPKAPAAQRSGAGPAGHVGNDRQDRRREPGEAPGRFDPMAPSQRQQQRLHGMEHDHREERRWAFWDGSCLRANQAGASSRIRRAKRETVTIGMGGSIRDRMPNTYAGTRFRTQPRGGGELTFFPRGFEGRFGREADQAARSGFASLNCPVAAAHDLTAWPHRARPRRAAAMLASVLR